MPNQRGGHVHVGRKEQRQPFSELGDVVQELGTFLRVIVLQLLLLLLIALSRRRHDVFHFSFACTILQCTSFVLQNALH